MLFFFAKNFITKKTQMRWDCLYVSRLTKGNNNLCQPHRGSNGTIKDNGEVPLKYYGAAPFGRLLDESFMRSVVSRALRFAEKS